MPYKSEKIAINNPELDRRVKLSPQTKDEIRELYRNTDISTRGLAKMFEVSRRLIQFILDEEKLKRDKELFRLRGGASHYSREYKAKSMREHRRYKHKLFKKGKIG